MISPRKLWQYRQYLIVAITLSLPMHAFAADEDMMVFKMDDLVKENAATDLPYLEFMRVEAMNAYLYELPAGSTDEQTPHGEDEIYYVVAGKSDFTAGDKTVAIEPGDVLYVRKNVVHTFSKITADLRLLVVFAPPDVD